MLLVSSRLLEIRRSFVAGTLLRELAASPQLAENNENANPLEDLLDVT